MFCASKLPFTYILNDISIKKEQIIVLNDCQIIIDYGNKTEEFYVKENDKFKYNINLIHTHKNQDDKYVNTYKSTALNKIIKFTCNTNSLKIIELIEEEFESSLYGEEERWEIYFTK